MNATQINCKVHGKSLVQASKQCLGCEMSNLIDSMEIPKMTQQEIALRMLVHYDAELSLDGNTVRVMDPVHCMRGSKSWIEYDVKILNIKDDLSSVHKFLVERG